MVYLLGAVVVAIAFGRGAAITAAILGVGAFDYSSVPPQFTFGVDDARYLITFAVMLTVAVMTGTLTARLREQRELARVRERRTAALYRLSHELDFAERGGGRARDSAVTWRRSERSGRGGRPAQRPSRWDSPTSRRRPAAEPRGGGTAGVRGRPDRRARARRQPRCAHMPLVVGYERDGVMSVETSSRTSSRTIRAPSRARQSDGLALERCRLANEATRRTQADTERARSALPSSVSHDLRTPLATITGAATTLRDEARAERRGHAP